MATEHASPAAAAAEPEAAPEGTPQPQFSRLSLLDSNSLTRITMLGNLAEAEEVI
jgi:hypothetical protein